MLKLCTKPESFLIGRNAMNSERQHTELDLSDLYRDIIMDHRRDPRHFGNLENCSHHAEAYNPVCGDRVCVQLKVNPETRKIEKQAFEGEGCSICMASASIMAEEIEAMSVGEAMERVQTFRDAMQDKLPSESIEGDLQALMGVKKFPVRIKCALLPWTTLKEALEKGSKI